MLQRQPHKRHAYATYAQQFSRDQSLEANRIAEHHGLHLTRDTLIIHLRMSGDLRAETGLDAAGVPLPLQPHDRAVFHLSGGVRLAFNDARKFGRIWLVADPAAVTGALGPEPFDETLTPQHFHGMLQARRRQLKPLLLDQTFLAGLGNIYTDEALHLSGLHPCCMAHTLDEEQSARLLAAIRAVLNRGIQTHGASIDWVYRGGDFQNDFRVYRRTGLPCPVCGTLVERTVTGQRSTHFCPLCQPLPR
jgi:formamidopyrimidine-DNA glycosylase